MYGIIWDLDDTLIASSSIYYQILIEVMAKIERDVYPRFITPQRIIDVYHTIDPKADDEYLSVVEDIERFPNDFPARVAKTYIECNLEGGRIPVKEDVQHVYNLGTKIFTHDYRLLPGAIKSINYLSTRSDVSQFVLTRGASKLQLPKLKKEIFRRFEKIVLCPDSESKGDYIKKLRQEYDTIDTWIMIGDDVNRDINPALAAGIWAIHVNGNLCTIAEGEVIDIGDTLKRYRSVRDLDELMSLLKGVLRNESKVQE